MDEECPRRCSWITMQALEVCTMGASIRWISTQVLSMLLSFTTNLLHITYCFKCSCSSSDVLWGELVKVWRTYLQSPTRLGTSWNSTYIVQQPHPFDVRLCLISQNSFYSTGCWRDIIDWTPIFWQDLQASRLDWSLIHCACLIRAKRKWALRLGSISLSIINWYPLVVY